MSELFSSGELNEVNYALFPAHWQKPYAYSAVLHVPDQALAEDTGLGKLVLNAFQAVDAPLDCEPELIQASLLQRRVPPLFVCHKFARSYPNFQFGIQQNEPDDGNSYAAFLKEQDAFNLARAFYHPKSTVLLMTGGVLAITGLTAAITCMASNAFYGAAAFGLSVYVAGKIIDKHTEASFYQGVSAQQFGAETSAISGAAFLDADKLMKAFGKPVTDLSCPNGGEVIESLLKHRRKKTDLVKLTSLFDANLLFKPGLVISYSHCEPEPACKFLDIMLATLRPTD